MGIIRHDVFVLFFSPSNNTVIKSYGNKLHTYLFFRTHLLQPCHILSMTITNNILWYFPLPVISRGFVSFGQYYHINTID